MKLYQIVAAFPALKRIGNIEMDFKDAYAIHRLVTALQPEHDFYCEQEIKTLQKYGGVLDTNSPAVKFPSEENNIAFQEERKKLNDTEVESKITVIKITVNETMRIPANDITVLTPFIEFIFNK